MTQTPTAVDHVGRDFFVAALAEFYAPTGFVEVGPHQRLRVGDNDLDDASSDTAVDSVRVSGTTAPSRAGALDLIADRLDTGHYLVFGRPTEIELSVYGNRPVRIRDRLPAGWTATDAPGTDDDTTSYMDDGVSYVEFDAELTAGTRTYVAKPPRYFCATRVGFGPMEYSVDDGDTWLPVAATSRRHTIPHIDSCT